MAKKILDSNGLSHLWSKIKEKFALISHTHTADEINELSNVAKSGSYNDLLNKPTIPSAVTVDTALSSTSSNPVQNKVIYNTLSDYAKKSDITTVFKFIGNRSSAGITTEPSTIDIGSVYNMSTLFTTNEYFVEGAGKTYPAGTNIVCVEWEVSSGTISHRWDVLGSTYDLSAYATKDDLDSYALSSSLANYVLLDDVSTAATKDTIVKRDSSGHITGNYIKGTWLYTSSATDKALSSAKGVAVLGTDGYIYYRSLANLKTDLGVPTITVTENSDGTVDVSIT